MPPETPNAPASTPAAEGAGEQGAQQPHEGAPAGQAPPVAAAPAVGEAQLREAQQRATEQSDKAEQLQAALDAVHQALNPDGGEGGQDPTQLAALVADRDKQLGDVGAQLRTAQVELAAYKAAGKEGARPDRLLNSRAFLDSVAGLDPQSPKFEQQLGAAITAAVEADPDLYRATPAGPSRGGAEFNGPPSADQRPKSLHDAVAARLAG
ncbi:hypothetical protein OIU91_19800 [Streptomyces sp. NBC_01456]|uniref:hypothetical protein n=1 Tax=Streptomyces sp. NBC_01456 TaxID=2975868 RepID=UPI002E3346D8|nr:hypothetical protein [Streptomyces sp. NBC_01456]